MCGVGRLLARPRIGAQFTLRAAGVLSSCGVSAKVSPQILLRLRPWIVWLNEGRGWWGLLSRSLFRGFTAKGALLWGWMGGRGCCNALSLCFFAPLARNAQHLGKCIDVWTGLDCGFKWLERYGCEREIVIGVILFHKLIETKRHVDWNVQNLALFAEILVA